MHPKHNYKKQDPPGSKRLPFPKNPTNANRSGLTTKQWGRDRELRPWIEIRGRFQNARPLVERPMVWNVSMRDATARVSKGLTPMVYSMSVCEGVMTGG